MSSGNQRPSILKRMSIVGGLSSAAPKAKPPAPAPSPPRLGPDASIEERRAQFPAQWPKDAKDHFPDTPQGELELKKGIVASEAMRVDAGNGYLLNFATMTQRGHYPSDPEKRNQDAYFVKTDWLGQGTHLFAVFDGHGPHGTECAEFARDNVPALLQQSLKINGTADEAAVRESFRDAHVVTNERLSTSGIDDMYSGTTAISVFCDRGTLYVSNVGDSRTMLGTATEDGGVGCEALSFDHTPYRSDERERVKQQGARVLSFDQVHGRRPLGESWDVKLGEEVDDVGDPPRVWDDSLETPGTAFTRSIGDSVAETLGIFAEPEVFTHDLKPSDRVIIVASDGVFEFLTMKQCVEIAMLYDDPEQAARALVGEAYKMWITRELRSDDITIVVAYVEPPSLERRDSTSVNSPVDTADNVDPAKSPRRASGSFYADENDGSPEPRRRSAGGPNGGADVVEIALDEGPVVNFKRDLRRLMLQCSSFCDANAAY